MVNFCMVVGDRQLPLCNWNGARVEEGSGERMMTKGNGYMELYIFCLTVPLFPNDDSDPFGKDWFRHQGVGYVFKMSVMNECVCGLALLGWAVSVFLVLL